MNLICDSAEAKVDIRVVFITPTYFCRFYVRCPVESLYLPQMLRSHTKSFLCIEVCLVCSSEGVIFLVSPDRAPPSGGFLHF